MKIKASVLLLSAFCVGSTAFAQPLHKLATFTHADTLRGSLNSERTWWDLLRYDITVKPDYANKSITGSNKITYFDNGGHTMQIDFQQPMEIDSIVGDGQKYTYERENNVFHVHIRDSAARYKIKPGPRDLTVYFHGNPRIAKKAPWDGGWIFTKDKQGRPWMTVACEGLGASAWVPCKEYLGDEPDSGASLSIIVPDTLMGVGNGRLISTVKNNDNTATYKWEVKNPINNYNIIPYIGKYVNFGEVFDGAKGKLDCNYWVMDYNLDKAKKQFTQVTPMLRCFESWFGPYPFYEDSYKLVESPHLGMEHQSAVAYGNNYQNGYYGKDLSETGWGLKWDFIIVHESGHEWFGNNISCKDIADMWIHESFTNYSETLYIECMFGKEAANDYVIGCRKKIANDIPIIGVYGVNQEGSGDMYYKGASMLHTIRQIINNDETFRNILVGLNKTFYHQTVTAKDIETYINHHSGLNFSRVFDQYLRTVQIPVLEYKFEAGVVKYRWSNCVKGFAMPVKVKMGPEKWLYPTEEWKSERMPADVGFVVDRNYYVESKKL